MTAAELLDALNRAGATVEMVEGKPRIRGAKISDELMAAVKANREAVLAECERRRAEDRDRYCRVPLESVPMFGRDLELPESMRRVLENYAMRQGRPAQAWVMKQANAYFELGVPMDDCEWRACVDLIAWQRQTRGREAVEFVGGVNEAATTINRRDAETQSEKASEKGNNDETTNGAK